MIRRLRVSDLCLGRGERRLFAGLNLEVSAGEALAVTGANGSGKTSLLRAVAGLMSPLRGTVTFEGESGPLEAETARARDLHLLGHRDGLKTSRTAGEEAAFWSRWSGGSSEALAGALEAFELRPILGLPVASLSAGQRRRVALSRLLAAPRRLWLLDEPMAPLDAAGRACFAERMIRHLGAGGLILAAVHDPLPFASKSLEISTG